MQTIATKCIEISANYKAVSINNYLHLQPKIFELYECKICPQHAGAYPTHDIHFHDDYNPVDYLLS